MKPTEFYIEYRDGVCCKFRKPTKDEQKTILKQAQKIEKLKKKIGELKSELEVVVAESKTDELLKNAFYDTAGHPYDVRHFFLTGKTDLI